MARKTTKPPPAQTSSDRNARLVAIIGGVVTFLTLAAAIYQTYLTKLGVDPPELRLQYLQKVTYSADSDLLYKIHAQSQLLGDAADWRLFSRAQNVGTSDQPGLDLDRHPFSVTRVIARLINSGTKPIRQEDISEPVKLTLPLKDQFYSIKVRTSNASLCGLGASGIPEFRRNSAGIFVAELVITWAPCTLNPGDSVDLDIMCAGDFGWPRPTAGIVGVHEIFVDTPESVRTFANRPFFQMSPWIEVMLHAVALIGSAAISGIKLRQYAQSLGNRTKKYAPKTVVVPWRSVVSIQLLGAAPFLLLVAIVARSMWWAIH